MRRGLRRSDAVQIRPDTASSKWPGDMEHGSDHRPRLRPVEAFPIADGEHRAFAVRDTGGISDVILSLSPPALLVLSLLDGTNTLDDVRRIFAESYGQALADETLRSMIRHLDEAWFLEGPSLEARYKSLTEEYRRKGVRPMPNAASLGIQSDGAVFREILGDRKDASDGPAVLGIIAPHLDYPRGAPCYAEAYGAILDRRVPDRVVILGTNHFGRGASVVATGCAFETPLGMTRADREFLDLVESRAGDLRSAEWDHVREHSVELQVAWLQHVFGADAFTIVPFLCSDPCGSRERDRDNRRELEAFAIALSETARQIGGDTLLVAGADMSHVGAAFGDDRPLNTEFLGEVERLDREALARLEAGDSRGFVDTLAERENETRICSAGCMFVLASALREAKPILRRYHQAVDVESGTCVTCAAMTYL